MMRKACLAAASTSAQSVSETRSRSLRLSFSSRSVFASLLQAVSWSLSFSNSVVSTAYFSEISQHHE